MLMYVLQKHVQVRQTLLKICFVLSLGDSNSGKIFRVGIIWSVET